MVQMSIEQKDSVWLEACEVLAKGFSKCSRQQFVAIIVDDDNQVVSIGYNGNVRGQEGIYAEVLNVCVILNI